MKSQKAMRVASLLVIERACEVFEDVKMRVAVDILTARQAREALRDMKNSLSDVVKELTGLNKSLTETISEKERQDFKVRVIDKVTGFLEHARDLILDKSIYEVGSKKIAIFQNEDFRNKVREVLDELDKQFKSLSKNLPEKNNIRVLNSVNKEIRDKLRVKIHDIDKNTQFEDIHLEETRTPRQTRDI